MHIHFYADDLHYNYIGTVLSHTTTRNILACIGATDRWMSSYRLKLHASKTQFA